MSQPILTEPGVKYFLRETLKNCNKTKYDYYNHLFNIALFIIFFTILGITIYYSYKDKKEAKDKEMKNFERQQYILNMVTQHNNKMLKEGGTKITDLPEFESEFEITMKKFI